VVESRECGRGRRTRTVGDNRQVGRLFIQFERFRIWRLLCSTTSLSDNPIVHDFHCSIDCSRAEVSPNDSSGSDHGVIMTHADYSPTDSFDTERLTVDSQYFSREEMISVLRLWTDFRRFFTILFDLIFTFYRTEIERLRRTATLSRDLAKRIDRFRTISDA
jgi:hypothetical protein